jgi:hypothetical protein
VPTERLSMRRIRQVLQLHFNARISARLIAREVGVGRIGPFVARRARPRPRCHGDPSAPVLLNSMRLLGERRTV